MPWIEIALPGSLLLLKFLLKLIVDRNATLPDFVSAILALPVDIVFLSAALLASHVISNPAWGRDGLFKFMTCLLLSLIIVFVWRRSEANFTVDKHLTAISLGFFNIMVSAATLIYSLNLLSKGATGP
jgi:hypothetical protein